VKHSAMPLFTGSGTAALLLLAACQRTESPLLPATPQTEDPPVASSEGLETKFAGPGHTPSEAELARFLGRIRTSPSVDRGTAGPAALAKAAALPTCRVTFNNSASLGTLLDQAYMGYAIRGYYQQTCNTSYTVISAPVTGVAYRLIPENSSWCPGAVSKIGSRTAAGDCINQSEGPFWPRRLGNDANSDGVSFGVHNSVHYRDFDLKALYVHSGAVEVWGFTPAGGWVSWAGLTAGTTWTFPAATTLSQLQIFESGRNARFLVDNLDIAIHP